MNEQELFKNYDVINEILKKNKKIKIIYQKKINKIYCKFF